MNKLIGNVSKLVATGAVALSVATSSLQAEETVKVGVLHSLSGTMAISETSLRDVLLFTFDEINANGGVLGKMIEPVVADGASDWPQRLTSEWTISEIAIPAPSDRQRTRTGRSVTPAIGASHTGLSI